MLHDPGKTTEVTYQPLAAGPIIVGQTPGGPKLEYAGEEGSFTFTGDQVQTQQSPIGKLISVSLRPSPGTNTTFTLVMPEINEEEGTQNQAFNTIAIKAKRGLVETEGADLTYSTLKLHGKAEIVKLPL